MDIQSIIGQVTESLGAAPEKAQDFLADPKAAIEEITGQTLGEGDIAEIVSGVKEKSPAATLTWAASPKTSTSVPSLRTWAACWRTPRSAASPKAWAACSARSRASRFT